MSTILSNRKTIFQLLFKLFFIVVPTLFISYFTLAIFNLSYTNLDIGIVNQAFYFGLGLVFSFILYFFRARFVFTFLILLIVYWVLGRILAQLDGEIDVFQVVVKFKLYATLFIIGWLFGFLLERVKFSPVIIAAFLTLISIIALKEQTDFSISTLFFSLFPVLAYALYLLFISPILADLIDLDFKKSKRVFLRTLVFLLLVTSAFWLSRLFSDTAINTNSKYIGEKGGQFDGGENENKGKKKANAYDERNGLLERGNKLDDGDDGYKLKDTMKMSDKMSQADHMMFCAKLKNYFPDGTPQPLYFVYHYLTKYDPIKESFIRDASMPYFDEFNVDPSSLAMYRSKLDRNIIKNCLASKQRKYVEAQVYVSSNTWKHALLAPASAYFVQAIPVDSGYKKLFRSAYRVKCTVSELNNAYFVYNPSGNAQLSEYQEQRFNALRSVIDYASADTAVLRYYTAIPKGTLYDSIANLAKRITKDALTPIDKVIAIRNYFLQTDKDGKKIFRYTLTPGKPSDPNIPNTSMLYSFLFKTHAGYCTYFAGASLFLLRSAGIPSRFTTGFATIDRADKNKGWYWFYASQAHAWTQVYFPDYGWLDFDMTIGNDDQREAPHPDGTPPLPPQEQWLVIDGKTETGPDLKSKQLEIDAQKIIFFNEDFQLNKSRRFKIDASVCRVFYGEKDTILSCIKSNDSLVLVSFDDASKKIPQPKTEMSIDEQVNGFPKPIIVDEIHIKMRAEDVKKDEEKKKVNEKSLTNNQNWRQLLWIGIYLLVGILIFIFLIPFLWLLILWLLFKFAKNPLQRADRAYQFGLYNFHMAGVERDTETPLSYAKEKTDPLFASSFTNFMLLYLRLKYSSAQLLPGDKELISYFGNSVIPSIRNKIGFLKMCLNYLNIFRAQRFFRKPNANDQNEY